MKLFRSTVLMFAILAIAACGSSTQSSPKSTATTLSTLDIEPTSTVATSTQSSTFTAEVWADNWFSLYVNGQLVGEDSVPITTERSFNAETITFTATYPLTIAMITKDYKETDSGLEYIGEPNQQMGDGGFVAQFTDTATGAIIATTNGDWRGFVIQTAPLNSECEKSADPNTECQFENLEEPSGWTSPSFDDATWPTATVYTADEVGVKDGYNEITWDANAELIWGSNLNTNNTILWRTLVPQP
ncbi:MAG: PEBP family protein [bacterium]|jgi:hypothetical protein